MCIQNTIWSLTCDFFRKPHPPKRILFVSLRFCGLLCWPLTGFLMTVCPRAEVENWPSQQILHSWLLSFLLTSCIRSCCRMNAMLLLVFPSVFSIIRILQASLQSEWEKLTWWALRARWTSSSSGIAPTITSTMRPPNGVMKNVVGYDDTTSELLVKV